MAFVPWGLTLEWLFIEGKQSTYPNPAFMLATVTEWKTLNVSYKPRLNQTWSITVAATDSQTNYPGGHFW